MIKENQFFNINKFPASEGLLVFGISMSKISNAQTAKRCFDYIQDLNKKVRYPYVGLAFLYSDNLYLYEAEDSIKLNKKLQSQMITHKNEFKRILNKNLAYIRDSFSFISWNQALLESKDFTNYFWQLKKIYDKDKTFQKYINEDIKRSGKKVSQDNILFILEEILVFYLVSKGEIKLHNKYLNGKEKWVLWCYPGKSLKSEIYLYKKNFFKLENKENIYQNSYYDLEGKKLYDYSKINLESIKL